MVPEQNSQYRFCLGSTPVPSKVLLGRSGRTRRDCSLFFRPQFSVLGNEIEPKEILRFRTRSKACARNRFGVTVGPEGKRQAEEGGAMGFPAIHRPGIRTAGSLKRLTKWNGEVPKRPTGADCKSAGLCLRRFESSPLHQPCAGIAQLARARAFQARGRGFESRFPLQYRDRETKVETR